MAVRTRTVAEICASAKEASRVLARLDSGTRDAALEAIAAQLEARVDEVLEANARDLEAGEEGQIGSALVDRLRLTLERAQGIARGVREIAALRDPVGEVLDGFRLPNGLDVRKVRVPLGVIAVVYESRPNVTIDCTALALKSGNSIVLRGSSMAAHSNAMLAELAREAIVSVGVPADAVALVAGGGREELREVATQDGVIDLLIPRGGEGLKSALKEYATVPVIYAASGNCHVYVDASADLAKARAIALNAKVQRPGVCNAAATPLVHAEAARSRADRAARALHLQVRGRGLGPDPRIVRLGIYGGVFNPPHHGHLIAAQEAHSQLALDVVLWIPAGIAPHRQVESDPGPE